MTLASRLPDTLSGNSEGVIELSGRSAAILRVREQLRRAATTYGGVLFVADRGIDVESVARDLHERSTARGAPFVAIDCADDVGRLDNLVFGSTAASSTDELESIGSLSRLAGARGGTLFLRDVAELPASVQARLARVVRDGEAFMEGRPVALTLRLMAGATPGIGSDVRMGSFRPDLFRRLSISRIDLPALRDRMDDLPALATRMLDKACEVSDRAPLAFSQAALGLLSALSWPGNIAELQSFVAHIVANLSDGSVPPNGLVQIEQLLPALKLDRAPARFVPAGSLREARLGFERDYITAVLRHHDWRMSAAAETLGIQRPNLYRKARQLGIRLSRATE
ncbi:MAG: sigma 54-interacting transcriptional regulator [Acidobacteriota bacterium]